MVATDMWVHYGRCSLSDFRRQQLLYKLKEKFSGIEDVHSQYVHFVQSTNPLAEKEVRLLERLLEYGPRDSSDRSRCHSWQKVYVLPRPGTVSPWCSKATDIAHICNLSTVTRIERGVLFYFRSSDVSMFLKCLDSFTGLLYDRMTQTVQNSEPTGANLFGTSSQGQLRWFDLSQGGRQLLVHLNTELGLSLSPMEIDYLLDMYTKQLQRPATDVELMMFAQVNSEHCRHKIFRGDWEINGKLREPLLIRHDP